MAFRAHSEYEIKDKLSHLNTPCDVICEVLEFLREYNLVNDRIYAERLARDLFNIKRFAKHRIIKELSQKGISREIAYEVTDELEGDEREILFPQMVKKLGGDFSQKSRDRAFRYFASRGYSFDDIKKTYEQAREEYIDEDWND